MKILGLVIESAAVSEANRSKAFGEGYTQGRVEGYTKCLQDNREHPRSPALSVSTTTQKFLTDNPEHLAWLDDLRMKIRARKEGKLAKWCARNLES